MGMTTLFVGVKLHSAGSKCFTSYSWIIPKVSDIAGGAGTRAGAAAGHTCRLDQTLQWSTGGASSSTKVLCGWRFSISFHNINTAGLGGKVNLCFAEFHTFLRAAALQLTGVVVAINGFTIDMNL